MWLIGLIISTNRVAAIQMFRNWWDKEVEMLAIKHLPEVHIAHISAAGPDLRPKIEKYLTIAAAAVVVFVLILSTIHAISARFAPAPCKITVKVHQGESLWTCAERYGNPNEYILKRVNTIARMNNLTPSRPLEIGQKLVVPVEHPTICAQAKTATP